MEINFKNITLADKQEITDILLISDKRFCEYTFGNMFCWGAPYGMRFAVTDGTLIVGDPEKRRFNYPAGPKADVVADKLLKLYPDLSFSCMDEKDAKRLCDMGFEVHETAERFDYIYESQKLSTLSGKKLAAKRNHINAFLSDGQWHTAPITSENVSELYEFNRKWCKNYCGAMNSSLEHEMCAVQQGLDNFEALGFSGLILYKNGEICAYSYGESINADTFCVHVEKADTEVRGAYQMINREFVRTYCTDYTYVNREDDAGDEGLRRAKLSYCPTELGKKFKKERSL